MIESARYHNCEQEYQAFVPGRIPDLESLDGDVWGNCSEDPRDNSQDRLASEEGVLDALRAPTPNATGVTKGMANETKDSHGPDSVHGSAPSRARGPCLDVHLC